MYFLFTSSVNHLTTVWQLWNHHSYIDILLHIWHRFGSTLFIDYWFSLFVCVFHMCLFCLKLPEAIMRVSLNSLTHCWSLCPSLLLSPFPPSSFHLCSERRSPVTQGCHVQKKLPSNNIEGCRAAVYSPPAHLMCPLPPSLSLSSPVVEMECYGWMVEAAAQPLALWWIWTTDTE